VRALPLLIALAAGAAPLAGAQDTTAAPAHANALGTVFDSVRLRPLAGAVVRLDTSDITATVDENGRFLLRGIPAGTHFFRIEHPLLDTLGLQLRSEAGEFAAGGTSVHILGTPSPERLIGLFCSPAWRARGPAALMGRVREADSGEPAAGAKVSLVWYEMSLETRLQRVARVREATVGADGIYRICGLPAQLDGKVQVIRGPLTSGDIAVNFGEDLLALRSMSIANPAAVVATAPDSAGRRGNVTVVGTARLRGRVLNKMGNPLVGARVQVEGTTRATTTRTNGDFALDSLPPGTQSVAVRLLGYSPIEQAVDLVSDEPRSVTIQLEDFVPTLETVRVTAQRERALDDVGFARRKRVGHGFYMDGDELKARSALFFSDVLRAAPGIRVVQTPGGRQMIQSQRDPMGGCVSIWVDGSQWQQMEPGDIDDFVKPFEVGALEVYSPTNTPAEFQSVRGASCTTIVAWTNRKLERRR
jgi:hypothetical protein